MIIKYTITVWRLQEVGGVREQHPQHLRREDHRAKDGSVVADKSAVPECPNEKSQTELKMVTRRSRAGHECSLQLKQGCPAGLLRAPSHLVPGPMAAPSQSWPPSQAARPLGAKELVPSGLWQQETQSGSKSRSCPNSIKEQHQKRNKRRRTQVPLWQHKKADQISFDCSLDCL